MKCVNCGKEVKEGSLFCPHCGKEVQIVPDYNAYEEDEYLKQVMKEANRRNPNSTGANAGASSGKKKSNKGLWIAISCVILVVFVAVVIGMIVTVQVRNRRASSFDYQLQLATEAQAKGDISAAIEYYENALSLDRENIEIRLTLVDIYLGRRDYDSAMILCHEILQMESSNRKACQTLIDINEMQKNYEAIVSLRDMVDASLMDLFVAYTLTPPAFSRESGTLENFGTVELSNADGFEIFYTMDGSDPTLRGERYTMPIELNENLKTYTIYAVCMNEKGLYSEVVNREYTVNIPAPGMPVVTPDSGEFSQETQVVITVPSDCTAYYTWDGTDPNAFCEKYTQPLTIPEGNNVLSVIIIDDRTKLYSDIYRGNFIYYSEDTEGEYIDDGDEE